MTGTLLSTIEQLIAALTYDEALRIDADGAAKSGDAIPLLDRSISHDLIQLERVIGARGQTLLSANAAAIDEALLLAEQARQMICQIAVPGPASNLRPAPLFLREAVVGKVLKGLDDGFPAGPVPDFADPVPGDWPDAPLPEPTEPGREDVNDTAPPAPPEPPAPAEEPDVPQGRTIRRRDHQASARRQAEARSSEKPVDTRIKRDSRIDAIRAAAEKLRAAHQPGSAPKRVPTIGVPVSRAAPVLPPLPAEQRRARLDAAVCFLRGKGVQVSVVDRQAMIRTYRVSGKRDAKYAEEVIDIAMEMGARL